MTQRMDLALYFFYMAMSVIIIAGLKLGSEVVVLVFLSVFIASILSAVLGFLHRKKIPKSLSYVLVFLVFVALFVFLFVVINHSLKDFISHASFYEEKINSLILSGIAYAQIYDVILEKEMIMESLNIGAFFKFSTHIVSGVGAFLSKLLLVSIGVAFILAESKSFENKLSLIYKQDKNKLQNFQLFSHNLQKYFIVKTFTSLLTGMIVGSMLFFFGVDYPVLWGILSFLFNFVPVVGSIIASVPALILSLIYFPIETTFWIGALYVFVNISISNIFEPRLMGQELGLSPMVIFFSLIFWGWTLGIEGMFLAVPITMTLKIAFESAEGTKWIGVLLSNVEEKM